MKTSVSSIKIAAARKIKRYRSVHILPTNKCSAFPFQTETVMSQSLVVTTKFNCILISNITAHLPLRTRLIAQNMAKERDRLKRCGRIAQLTTKCGLLTFMLTQRITPEQSLSSPNYDQQADLSSQHESCSPLSREEHSERPPNENCKNFIYKLFNYEILVLDEYALNRSEHPLSQGKYTGEEKRVKVRETFTSCCTL